MVKFLCSGSRILILFFSMLRMLIISSLPLCGDLVDGTIVIKLILQDVKYNVLPFEEFEGKKSNSISTSR